MAKPYHIAALLETIFPIIHCQEAPVMLVGESSLIVQKYDHHAQ
jgi:hypothetical protein